MKYFAVILIILLSASGCKSTNNSNSLVIVESDHPLYFDDEFSGYQNIVIETKEEVFALDDEMKQFVKKELLPVKDVTKKARKLVEHIFKAENMNLNYVGKANLTARQTYHSGEANCISLTIMAYALANEADFHVNFQQVDVPEYWQRNGSFNMLTGHVNLVLKRQQSPTVILMRDNIMEIDFDPFVAKKSFSKQVVSKETALAMFYNNKGAHALAVGDNLVAYRYFKEATLIAPSFSPAWGNLGILYKKSKLEDFAKASYQRAIKENFNNNTALTNYAILLRKQGLHEKAEQVELAVLKKRVSNPYYYALLGDEALHRGEYLHAISHYKKAIKLDSTIDDLYVGLASVYHQQKNFDAAKRAMRKAIAINRRPNVENQYIAKLDLLKAREATH